MRTLLFIVGAVVIAGLIALGIRKFLETTTKVQKEGAPDDDE